MPSTSDPPPQHPARILDIKWLAPRETVRAVRTRVVDGVEAALVLENKDLLAHQPGVFAHGFVDIDLVHSVVLWVEDFAAGGFLLWRGGEGLLSTWQWLGPGEFEIWFA